MTRFIFYTATSFNGFIADRENSLEWLFAVGSPDDVDFARFFEGIGALVSGSTTYEWVLDHENLIEQPGRWREIYGDRPSFVFTSRELPSPDGADISFLEGEVSTHLDRIREAAGGKDVWIIGGGELATRFLESGALDEIQISVAPVALAGGAPLFPAEVL
ncbi:MAG: dihydrofolate reductase family protein, partial [Actinomycetota bacterium]|nr:dihydrofolate reductase family protein [Actinomycetota bacterium]